MPEAATIGLEGRRTWVRACGERYWPGNATSIADLPLPAATASPFGSGRWTMVALPDWASDVGIDGTLLVDAEAVLADGPGEGWERCDWLHAAWLHLTAAHERRHESDHGPTRSYAFRLGSEAQPLYDRAWVNRIFLFLRRWAARLRGVDEATLFGPLPHARIVLTHDVDAVSLTPEIRFKQSAFHVFNAARNLGRGRVAKSRAKMAEGLRFAFGRHDLRSLADIRKAEDAAGLRSLLHVYGGDAGWRRGSPVRILIDPAYSIESPYMRAELEAFSAGGWSIGLHQSTAAWRDSAVMLAERRRVESASGRPVTACRQHWLRFSFGETWAAQQQAGLELDSTLGFNDRPGFRNGSALQVRPWDAARGMPMSIATLPMLFMDSHFYDYLEIGEDGVAGEMARWLEEVRAVGGEASVNWHTHTITPAYGWGGGYRQLLALLG